METQNPINLQVSEKKSISPLLVLGLFALCSTCFMVLVCGGIVWTVRNPENLSFLAGPKEDIVEEVSTDPKWKAKLVDEFINNENGWNVESDEEDTVTLERTLGNGKFIWDFRATSGWNFWNWPDIEMLTDSVTSLDIRHTAGSDRDGYGIVFRVSGRDFYAFAVNESGQYAAWMYHDEKITTFVNWKQSYLIQPGEVNQIAVKAIGSQFTFYINQQQVATASDKTLTHGYSGVYLSPSGLPASKTATPIPNPNSQNDSGWNPSTFEIRNFKIFVTKESTHTDPNGLPILQPQPGHLVYMSDDEIYAIDTDGNNPVNLTNSPGEDYSPRWSPDGKQIVFVSRRDGNAEIYLMNRDGSGTTRLTDNPGYDESPAWSHDGEKIVFSSDHGGRSSLYILDLRTKSLERITTGRNDIFPDWSPDGNLIIFQSSRHGGQDIYLFDLTTKKETRLTFSLPYMVARPVWSLDGLSYVHETITSDHHIGITISDYLSSITETVVDSAETNLWPTWSPDGTQIAFISYRSGQSDIYIVSRDGKSIYRVTNDRAIEGMVDWTAE